MGKCTPRNAFIEHQQYEMNQRRAVNEYQAFHCVQEIKEIF